MKRVRCAIYTRKSSEEGLEQDFNSLDAQHAACVAYIQSQASEGWTLVKARYDDGGISGGTLDRPGLARLLADIAAGQVDIVVVYKVDRLTRSLLDFSKLVEAFDQAGVSFVSVTQSFNTTTSMGRLTLNMLLSFAQFEREVTAERIRDKIAASKQRGMWMGGTPPIGYKPDGRSLAIVEDEADLVRQLFQRYLDLGSVRALHEALLNEHIHQPRRTSATGRAFGGGPFQRGQLYRMLGNPLYRGLIRHRSQTWPGNHPAIINEALWDQVQARLRDNTQGEQLAPTAADPSLLAGKLFDPLGQPLVATHASKGKVRYRYYVSRHLQHGWMAPAGTAPIPADQSPKGLRIPAREIEPLVLGAIRQKLADAIALGTELGLDLANPDTTTKLMQASRSLSVKLADKDGPAVQGILARIVQRVEVYQDSVKLSLAGDALCQVLGTPAQMQPAEHPERSPDLILTLPVRLKRSGMAVRLILDSGRPANSTTPDTKLLIAIAKGRRLWQHLLDNPQMTLADLARSQSLSTTYVDRILRLTFLSPTITQAVLDGTTPADLTLDRLKTTKLIAPDWAEQHRLLGISSPAA
jgi:DNA invertase Pin-like site-specific DNA recombinase